MLFRSDYIIRVHLKDVVVGDFAEGETCVDGQKIVPVATGSGIIPMKELLLALKKDGYTGALAIEYSMKKGAFLLLIKTRLCFIIKSENKFPKNRKGQEMKK